MTNKNINAFNNRSDYAEKKNYYNSMLTIYGRKPVLEALQDRSIPIHKIHLSDSNKPAKIISDIESAATYRNIEISYHDKLSLSRISRNSKQDQGVAADLALPNIQTLNDFFSELTPGAKRYIALDNIHNPQNVGMIIRSVAAGGIDALFIPRKGCAEIGPLAIKASAGAIFKCPIVRCENIEECISAIKKTAAINICTLDLSGDLQLTELDSSVSRLFVLGNESEGVSNTVNELANERVLIPLANNVESLNVAITAALIAFMT